MISFRRNRYHHPGEWLVCRYLSPWLDVATKGLSDESKARVRGEIGAHFHDAVDDGMRAGLTEDCAAEQALTSLGSPKSARRAFRRTYLTRYQASNLRALVEPTKRILFLYAYMVSAATVLTVVFARGTHPEWYARAGMVALMALAAGILTTAVPRLYRRGRQRAAIKLGAGAGGLLWLLWFAFVARGAFYSENRSWILVALLVWWTVNVLPLVRKADESGPRTV